MSWLINTAQFDRLRKDQKGVVVLDASWHMPSEARDARREFVENHVAGARFLDLDAFHDKTTTLPNMLLRDEQKLSELVGALGITNDHKIVFYDNSSHHSSCRALWMFKVLGHPASHLYVLDGGLPMWKRYGGKLEMGESQSVGQKNYAINFQGHLVRTLVQMKANLHHPQEQVVDLRSPVRYAGGAEPRPGLRRGHIPGSFSFPYTTMFDDKGMWKPLEKIRRQLEGIGVSLQLPVITTCGSGMTAAILDFALDLMNHTDHSLYDGSWSEWGADQLFHGEFGLEERPVVTSLQEEI